MLSVSNKMWNVQPADCSSCSSYSSTSQANVQIYSLPSYKIEHSDIPDAGPGFDHRPAGVLGRKMDALRCAAADLSLFLKPSRLYWPLYWPSHCAKHCCH